MPFTIERNDLAKMRVDAVVVAANERLRIAGGVGGAVAAVAGFEEMQAACDALGGCSVGSAVATPGFRLPAKVVVHAVGPRWEGARMGQADLLRAAYDSALRCAAEAGADSIALPLISAGSFGFPAGVSLEVATDAVKAFLEEHDAEVTLVLYDREALVVGLAAYGDIAAYIDDHYVEGHRLEGTAVLDAPIWEADSPIGGGDAGTAPMAAAASQPGLADLLDSLDAPFSTTLLALIDARGLVDSEVYKRANMSRQLFSKIHGDAAYRPTKKTVLALAIALELDLDETGDLLRRAGFALSSSSKADVIVEYFIAHGNHDIFKVNEALYAFDQPLL